MGSSYCSVFCGTSIQVGLQLLVKSKQTCLLIRFGGTFVAGGGRVKGFQDDDDAEVYASFLGGDLVGTGQECNGFVGILAERGCCRHSKSCTCMCLEKPAGGTQNESEVTRLQHTTPWT